jgi:hypothetical protein
VVVARDPAALRQAAGITNVIGPYSESLPNDGGTVRCATARARCCWRWSIKTRCPGRWRRTGRATRFNWPVPTMGGLRRGVGGQLGSGGSPGRPDPEIQDPLGGW